MEAVSLLSSLPTWKQRLAQLFTNPYYFRFKADMELVVDLAGINTRLQGPAIYERVMFR